MRAALLVLLCAFAGGAVACETPYRELLAQNNANLARLALGMAKDEVVKVMGDCTTQVKGNPFGNPLRVEAWQKGADTYEVLYYLTRRYQPFTPVRESQATPVVLRNGQVIGWGKTALRDIRNETRR